jgi:hypothetical protein
MGKIDANTLRWADRVVLVLFAISMGLLIVAWAPWPTFSDVETLVVLRAVLVLISGVGAVASVVVLIARWLLVVSNKRS